MHPLTLEDILQQEPREKLELFPKLGYYFIVFRAIEARGLPQPDHEPKTDPSVIEDEGHLAEVYVYLVVFPDGICTVRDYVLSLGDCNLNSFHVVPFRRYIGYAPADLIANLITDFCTIKEHTERVRSKIRVMEKSIKRSSGSLVLWHILFCLY